jgi:predicted GIY-YIG superfamily endonuclease
LFYLYEIECLTPNYFYVGISETPDRRIEWHRRGLAARFTAKHGVKAHRILWRFSGEGAAKKAEWSRVKQLEERGHVVRGGGRSKSGVIGPLPHLAKYLENSSIRAAARELSQATGINFDVCRSLLRREQAALRSRRA